MGRDLDFLAFKEAELQKALLSEAVPHSCTSQSVCTIKPKPFSVRKQAESLLSRLNLASPVWKEKFLQKP